MQKNFFKRNWQVILINLLLLVCFIIFYGQFGNVFVDCFREAYIPEQMLKGNILYKNIFCIYPPFAYVFNALLFKIFGVNLNVLYFAGFFASALILNLIYQIGNKFLPQFYSLIITLLTISVLILSPNVFNTIFPYSFGIVYGLVFALFSVYFALNKKFPLSYLMYSFAICSKYEFLFLLPAIIYLSGKKDIVKNIFGFTIPIILTYLPLFLSGLTLSDLYNQLLIIIDISSTKTLHYYYKAAGLVFSPQMSIIYLVNFIKILIPILLISKYKNIYSVLFLVVYLFYFASPALFVYIFPLILILFVYKFKTLNKKQKFLIMSTLLISAKCFFALALKSYGVYYIPLGVLSIFILISKNLKKSFLIVLIMLTLIYGVKNSVSLAKNNQKISSQRGSIYTTTEYGNSINEILNYIEENTSANDKIYIFPEMTALNFFTKRDNDNKLYSLIPMYVESFGEEGIIKRIEAKKPKYIVIVKYDTSEYFYKYFGEDYAKEIFKYIEENYTKVKEFESNELFMVYKSL